MKIAELSEILALSDPGRKQVLSVQDWAEIRRLHQAQGMAISEIARVFGISRNTVRSALTSNASPKYQRARSTLLVDGFEDRIWEMFRT